LIGRALRVEIARNKAAQVAAFQVCEDSADVAAVVTSGVNVKGQGKKRQAVTREAEEDWGR
jgi:hypothetical protein